MGKGRAETDGLKNKQVLRSLGFESGLQELISKRTEHS